MSEVSKQFLDSLKEDTKQSSLFFTRSWIFLLSANIIAFVVSYYIGLKAETTDLVAMVAITVVAALTFYVAKSMKWRLLVGFLSLGAFVFWDQLFHPSASTLALPYNLVLGTGDTLCLLKGAAVSSVALMLQTVYFWKRNIAPVKGAVMLISLVSATAGTVMQAWCCRGGSFGHALKSHLGTLFVVFLITFVIYDLLRSKWLKNQIKK